MTCKTCGAELSPTAIDCATCGQPVAAERPTGGPRPGATGTEQRTPRLEAPRSPAGGVPPSGDVPRGGGEVPPGGVLPGGGARPGGEVPPEGGVPPGGGAPPGGGVPPSGPPPGAGPAAGPPHPSGFSSETRGWAIGAHLGALVLGLSTAAVLGFLVPLVVWLLKREEDPFVEHHAKESLNFQLTVLVALAASLILAIPAVLFGVLTLGLGFVLVALLALAAVLVWLVLPIIGSVKAGNGEGFRYPVTIRFIR